MNRTGIIVAWFFLASGAWAVEEPEGYRGEPYLGAVPETLTGGTVLDDDGAYALWEAEVAFVDVLPHTPKPDLPEGTIWHEPDHESIEGAIWLPNVGYDRLPDIDQDYFNQGLEFITEGNQDAALVFFCRAECWMSWNAAKRALEMGYGDVYWYPDGVDGWGMSDFPMEVILPWEAPEEAN